MKGELDKMPASIPAFLARNLVLFSSLIVREYPCFFARGRIRRRRLSPDGWLLQIFGTGRRTR